MEVERSKRITRAKFVPKLLKVAGRIPFAEDIASAWFCTQDRNTPKHVKAILLASLAYFVVPTDMVPDIIAGLGFTDDATVLATAISIVGSKIKPEHRRAARRLLRLPEPTVDNDTQDGATTSSR